MTDRSFDNVDYKLELDPEEKNLFRKPGEYIVLIKRIITDDVTGKITVILAPPLEDK